MMIRACYQGPRVSCLSGTHAREESIVASRPTIDCKTIDSHRHSRRSEHRLSLAWTEARQATQSSVCVQTIDVSIVVIKVVTSSG